MFFTREDCVTVIILDENQTKAIDKEMKISNEYGEEASFFDDIESIFTANKVVTCNGRPLKKKGAVRPVPERIHDWHTVLKFTNGKYVVSSQEFDDQIKTKKIIEINESQVRFYNYIKCMLI